MRTINLLKDDPQRGKENIKIIFGEHVECAETLTYDPSVNYKNHQLFLDTAIIDADNVDNLIKALEVFKELKGEIE